MERKDVEETILGWEQATPSSPGVHNNVAVPVSGDESQNDEHQPLLSKKIAARKRGEFYISQKSIYKTAS